MAELIYMPKLGFDMQEGEFVGWLKGIGDRITSGDLLAEIESDKATIEVEVFDEGTLLEFLVGEGDIVPVGAPIAVLGEAGEAYDLAALGVGGEEVAPAASAENVPEITQKVTPLTAEELAAATAVFSKSNGHGMPAGLRISPLAKRIAAEEGIDLSRVAGSGPMGRIVKSDIAAIQESGYAVVAPAVSSAPRTMPSFTPAVVGDEDESIPTPKLRQRIAARMLESKQTIPHFYVTTDVDMEAALNLRKELNDRREKEDRISVNDLIVKAVALALREFPNINSTFNGDTIIRHNRVNVGIAVAVEGGLMNVVSQNADVTPLTMMGRNHREMIGRARIGKVKPDDIMGETFAVSNLGAYDVDHFIAIINPPAAAILAVGSAAQVPVVVDGELGIGWRMKATVSADHRVTDGAEVAQYLQRFKQIMEDPLQLLM